MTDTQTTPSGRAVPASLPPGYLGSTPLLQQYFSTRLEHPGIILLMRVGDFYEAYGDDAETIASDLHITLTRRMDSGVEVPMAGVPHHAYERYLARLIQKRPQHNSAFLLCLQTALALPFTLACGLLTKLWIVFYSLHIEPDWREYGL